MIEEQLDIPLLLALREELRETPLPESLLVAFFGYKPSDAGPFADKVNDPAELAALFGMLRPE